MESRIIHKQTVSRTWIKMAAAAIVSTCLFASCAPVTPPQKTFANGEQASAAMIKAIQEDNKDELLAIFGADAEGLISSGDTVADRFRRNLFIKAYEEKHQLSAEADKLILVVGRNDWPFPIPLIKQGQQWFFDTAAGKEEILNRRIGFNELNTIQVLLAVVDAQREYAMMDRDGDGLLEYAQKFMSDPGTQNGLYWETKEGQPPSPLGSLIAQAKEEGYASADKPQPYFGYTFRILTAQGENASGGAFGYIVDGSMMGGFAVIASPAEFGNSGVMTFMVNHDGAVYQKDLGEETEQVGRSIPLFDPDKTWTKTQ